MQTLGIIPARIGSTRLPRKLLLPIQGKPLIQHTYEQAIKCAILDDVFIVTDSDEIVKACQQFGAKAFITNSEAPTGTDRIAEAVGNYEELSSAKYLINIQGDEPSISPETIEQVALAIQNSNDAVVSTAVFPIMNPSSLLSSSVVKCVRDLNGYALYFSRALIPSSKNGGMQEGVAYYKHLGIYGYKKSFLQTYVSLPASPLQKAEDLEQLKVLENGYKMITVVAQEDTAGIDIEDDYQRFKQAKENS